ncbi:zinc ribbon domain-containing protein [Candidatus Saccharibacteria bacterium]|nr:zinc ribbon domain-containing protein [Candidatus Saccharibacteria bacterium]
MEKVCQSCGMPLDSDKVRGTEADGSLNGDYCIYCYKEGKFTQPDLTLEGAIEQSAQFADQAGMTAEQAVAWAKELFPTLKRWK